MNEKIKQFGKVTGKTSWGDRIFLCVVYTVLFAVTFCCAYPLYFTVIASVSESDALYTGQVVFLPKEFHLQAYTEILKNDTIWTGYGNTIFYTVFGTALNLILTIPTAYALSRKELWGRSLLTGIFLFTMYFGGGMIPTYILFKNLNLINTRTIMILQGGLSIYNVVITRNYFLNNIPEGLHEAAKIDGANAFSTFGRVVLPLSGSIIAVITLYYAVGHWCSYFNAMIYLTEQKLYPLQLVLRKILIMNESALQTLQDTDGISEEMIASVLRMVELSHLMKYSLIFIASAPMLVFYPFMQKYFVKGIMAGALKG